MSGPGGERDPGKFVPETFCDEVYDFVDDNVAEAMDDMEKKLLKAVKAKPGGEEEGAQVQTGIEEAIKIFCDKVQKRVHIQFDRNLDIFDRAVKSGTIDAANPLRTAPPSLRGGGRRAAVVAFGPGKGGRTTANGESVRSGAGARPDSGAEAAADKSDAGTGMGRSGGDDGGSSSKGKGWWYGLGIEVEEGTAPKRAADEEALDVEIEQLQKRRRKALRTQAEMVRRGARDAAVLQDVNDCIEALRMGVSSSFDDNGLTPLPAKVQEAVNSGKELKKAAERARELTRELEGKARGKAAAAGGGGGGGACGSSSAARSIVAAAPAPRDLQAKFKRSSEQQVTAGGVADYTVLEARRLMEMNG